MSWIPPVSLASQIPSAVSGTCTITCTTYNGSTSIGSKTCTLTLTVPSSVVPTIGSLTATRVDGDVPSSWGIYVQSKSKATITITGATGSYGSTISSYSYAPCSSKNIVTRSIYYKKSTDTAWTNANTAFSSGTSITFGIGNLSSKYSYDIKYTIADQFHSISVYDVVTTAAVVMDFKAGGKGVAIGKVSELDDTFEVSEKWDVKVYGKLLKEYILQSLYPVGSIYLSVNSTNPGSIFGGTWSQLKDRFLLGAGSSYTNGATGGAATVTLTTSQMPAHTHTFTGSSATTSSAGAHTHKIGRDIDDGSGSSRYTVHSEGTSGADGTSSTGSAGAHTHTLTAKGTNASTGGGGSHNNMPPYLVVYMWKRTA